MPIEPGQRLPEATLTLKDAEGVQQIQLADRLAGRKVVIFAVPGAYTPTCSSAHLPSFVRTLPDLRAKGVDEVICLSVNDPFVMEAWGKDAGADGISMMADADGAFTAAIGMAFDAPAVGLLARSVRYSMLVEDGEVTRLNLEQGPGVCELTAGETLLAQL